MPGARNITYIVFLLNCHVHIAMTGIGQQRKLAEEKPSFSFSLLLLLPLPLLPPFILHDRQTDRQIELEKVVSCRLPPVQG
jgi:hypothetical protein